MGTPDDQRMFEVFGDKLGPIHIGPGAVSKGNKVTDLEFLRWRETVYGTIGQRIKQQAKKQAAIKKTSHTSSASSSLSSVSALDGDKPAVSKKGNYCSNIDCQALARYSVDQRAACSKCIYYKHVRT